MTTHDTAFIDMDELIHPAFQGMVCTFTGFVTRFSDLG
eukprot:CAMPEP_0194421230 /NCGR_PEP_ID=MMETSP0176-20130528/20440_1 /TAXON_ID=216777 /ORGANISM="Proboscia alata, Strain PI-D3" /LENGTH=37 /DNA_ID= /DNA_START= /DNA_END= /DNA_ORIENTATION=